MFNMDFDSFPTFREFLEATQDYGRTSGYRFRIGDVPEASRSVVSKYIARIRSGEGGIAEDLMRAQKICEQEGIRNVMISTCKELNLWPPKSPDRLQSMAYTDMSEPLETIAWALFNYDKSLKEIPNHENQRRTASYLVDFAHAVDQPIEISKAGSQLLLQFLERAKEWTDSHKVKRGNLREVILQKLNEFADPTFIREIESWFDQHWEAIAVGGIALVAGFALAAFVFGSRNKS